MKTKRSRGERPTTVIDIGLWARDYQQVDLFNWQEAIADMITLTELEVELATAEGTVRRAVDRGLVCPDHTLTLGERVYHYFRRDSIEGIRETLGLPKVADENIKQLFLAFVGEMDMAASYKPVMLLALLDAVDNRGRRSSRTLCETSALSTAEGRTAWSSSARWHAWPLLTTCQKTRCRELCWRCRSRSSSRHYLRYDRDLAYVRFDPRCGDNSARMTSS